MKTTAPEAIALIAPGIPVTIRDEDWLVRKVTDRGTDGRMVNVIGMSELVRGTEATFFTTLDRIEPTRPEETRLIQDDSPAFRKSRLFIESLIRKTPLPASETGLSTSPNQLLDPLNFQQRPVQMALEALRPRLLIADAVGLGKTLEVGMILTELIRRGRGDRIIVVTPRHILAQFQQELWTRFSIPLVRLDSEGIQRVRQKIPATRNPFSYYKRVIISIDTLKNAGRYRHHLEDIRWDAAVFDECHNLVGERTLNRELATVIAPRSRALILTSATPHNGDPESFARLIELLDPTAIADPSDYKADEISHLYIRRHKADSEVSAEVGSNWADRLPPEPIAVGASPAENALFDELTTTWLRPEDGKAPISGKGTRLFPYTLLKAALSSHRALNDTLANRRKVLAKDEQREGREAEDQALQVLEQLNDQIDDTNSSKLVALVEQLKKIGIGPKSKTRVVIFSERIATVNWLAESLPGLIGLKDSNILTMHGGKSDLEQQAIVEEFSLGESKARILITGDIASEGVNLHRECHQLIHYDLPWSLITLEQRNGRIDRYGQRHSPEMRALLLTPDNEEVRGDVTVLRRLLEKEHNAHLALGESASIMGFHSASKEEEEIFKALSKSQSPDEKAATIEEIVPDRPKAGSFDLEVLLARDAPAEPIPHADAPALFESDEKFLRAALDQAFDDAGTELDIREEPEHALISLVPPADLARRMDALPQSYLKERKITERLRLTSDQDVANESLRAARESSDSSWPEVGFLSSQHPIMDWAVDKVLSDVERNAALLLPCGVEQPTFLVQGVYSNEAGEPTVVEWMAVDDVEEDQIATVSELSHRLAELGINEKAINSVPHLEPDRVAELESQVPIAVAAARSKLIGEREDLTASLDSRVREHRDRLLGWSETSHGVVSRLANESARTRAEKQLKARTQFAEAQIAALETTGDPLVRVIAVLIPEV